MSQTVLAYALPDRPLPIFSVAMKDGLFRGAIYCWILPLVFGVSIFGLWTQYRSFAFAVLGLATIGFGTIMALIGGFALLVFTLMRWRETPHPERQVLLPAVVLAVLIASNFLAAAAVLNAVARVQQARPVPGEMRYQ